MTQINAQDPNPHQRESKPSKFLIYILVLLLILNAGLRIVRLRSDSPALPNNFRNVAPYKDEGAKAHEARNKALFGSFQPHPADNYKFWSVQSPVWTYTLLIGFKVLGTSYASLRLLSVLFALITLAAGAVMLFRSGFSSGAIIFTAILGLNFYFLIFTRLGLMEPMVILWLALCAMMLVETRSDPRFFIPASLFLLAGIFTKPSALLFLPVWAGYLAWHLLTMRSAAKDGKKSLALIAISTAIIFIPMAAAYTSHDFREFTGMSVRHGFHLTDGVSLTPLVERILRIGSSFAPKEIWRSFFMTLPCASILGTGWIAYMGYRALKRKQVSGLEWMLLFWFLIGRASATATPHQVMRFHLLYFFPISMMAAMAADRMWRTKAIGSRKKAIQTLVIAFVAYELVMTGVPWFKWVLNPRYDLVDASGSLGKILESEEDKLRIEPVVIGEWAGPLSLENDMVCHYVKGTFNMKREQLASFKITHLLESKDRYDHVAERFKKFFPQRYEQRKKVAEFPVRTRHLVLWRVAPITEPKPGTLRTKETKK